VSRREGDGGDTTGSGEEESSVEDEFRRWAEETEAGPTEAPSRQGWAARIFGRADKTEAEPLEPVEEEPDPGLGDVGPSPADLENPEPDELGVFRAIDPLGGPPPGLRAVPDVEDADGADGADGADDDESDRQAETTDDGDTGDTGDTAVPVTDEAAAPEPLEDSGQSAAFAELWGERGDPTQIEEDRDDIRDDIVDFADFTSEDYLAATTREYAGLAEAVARAEEEGAEQIAVAAEIPGLERGIVGLDDMMDAEGGAADVIEPPSASDLSIRVLTAVGLVVLFGASLLSPYGIGALIFVVLGIAAGELFASFIRGGYRPLSIFGFLGIVGAFVGTWMAGPVAVPLAMLVTVVSVFLFYATVPGRRSVVENASLTVIVTAWIGGLGAFAFDLLQSDDYTWLVLALVVTVAAMDIGQYFIGRRLGRRALAPVVSPRKTVEGYIAGVIVAIGVGAAFGLAPPFELADGLLIGAVVAIVAPIGDLAVSVVKRALGVKDMGYILPGHGGVLDRVDAMIVTIPALWIAYSWMGLLT
jgi:phosphatidate cytidylyltransferase